MEKVPLSFLEFLSTTWIFCSGCNALKFVHDDLSAWADERDGVPNTNPAITSDRMNPFLHFL